MKFASQLGFNVMARVKPLVLMLVALIIGYGVGFILRPVIAPSEQTAATVPPAAVPPNRAPAEARGVQYFEAKIAEARRVVASCREGSVRGAECANADAAVIKVESRARFRRFRGER